MVLPSKSVEQEQRRLASAIARLSRLDVLECFDPVDPASRPTPAQLQVLKDIDAVSIRYVTAGNQCHARDTLVMTTRGPVPIQDIQIGTEVYDENGNIVRVTKVWSNGIKEVGDVTVRRVPLASCTAEHKWWTRKYSKANGVVLWEGKTESMSFEKEMGIRRISVKAPLGSVREPHAYAIGALLGDGCSRQKNKYLIISSGIPEVPTKVAAILGGEARRLHEKNYNWSIGYVDCHHYDTWCRGRYAHEKIVNLEVIKSWDRQSLLEFVAGVIDTDGSIHPARDHITISIGMQTKSVVDAIKYAFLALWQVQLHETVDSRGKYKNGPVYTVYTRNAVYIREVMTELDPHIVSPQKKWRAEYSTLGGRRTRADSVTANWGTNRRVVDTYDLTVDGENNVYMLANGLISSNSGKTQIGARELSWIFTETHPYWKRREEWGSEPLLLLVVARVGAQAEEVLWRKISAFLDPGDYTIKRVGGSLEKVVHNTNGNTIIFKSHHDEANAREKLQAYVAHYVWVDELPKSVRILEELHRRRQAKRGPFLATFTPKDVNVEIQKLVDSSKAPTAKKYQFHMFDNPIYTEEDKRQILESLSTYSETYRNTILRGDWATGEDQVYYINYDTVVEAPRNYSYSWRHVEAVDPALKSALGLTVWAEDPTTHIWYCIRDDYVKGIYVPTELVDKVEELTRSYNVIRRISDPHEVWYISTAAQRGRIYQGVYKKNERKGELIKGLQEKLGVRVRIAPWCQNILVEFSDCRWSSVAENRIVNSSSFHLLDSAQYFCDSIPAPDVSKQNLPFYDWLYRENEKRIIAEERAARHTARGRIRRRGRVW